MAKFVFLYYDGNPLDNEPPSEEGIAEWMQWFQGLGDKIVDGGAPFNGNGHSVSKKGAEPIGTWPATGYTIVEADSMDDAITMTKGCPALNAVDGAVRVYESVPM